MTKPGFFGRCRAAFWLVVGRPCEARQKSSADAIVGLEHGLENWLDCRFSKEELLGFIRYVLPEPAALRPELQGVPPSQSAFLFRVEMNGLRDELERARAMDKAREDAKKRSLTYRLRAFRQRVTRRKTSFSGPHAL